MTRMKILRKKVLISGANGLLGQKCVSVFLKDYEVYGADIQEKAFADYRHYHYVTCDITSRNQVNELVKNIEPDFIINAAAYTNVDACEEDRETCWKVNVNGIENLAKAAFKKHIFIVHISTDYIFDGESGPYSEDSKPNPLGYYGRSKLAGENALIASGAQNAILRTMVLYGCGENLRDNFALWLLKMLQSGKEVTIVDDQYGHPTIVDDLAKAILKVVEKKQTGVFHVTGSEYVNRLEFAHELADVFGLRKDLIKAIKTSDLNQKAPRPFRSEFNLDKLRRELGITTMNVRDSLLLLKEQLEQKSSL